VNEILILLINLFAIFFCALTQAQTMKQGQLHCQSFPFC